MSIASAGHHKARSWEHCTPRTTRIYPSLNHALDSLPIGTYNCQPGAIE